MLRVEKHCAFTNIPAYKGVILKSGCIWKLLSLILSILYFYFLKGRFAEASVRPIHWRVSEKSCISPNSHTQEHSSFIFILPKSVYFLFNTTPKNH
jgi:hypothetical protein